MTKNKSIKLLLLEDDHVDVKLINDILLSINSHHYDVTHIDNLIDAKQQLTNNSFDAILLDVSLPPGDDPLKAITTISKASPSTPIIALDNEFNETLARKTAHLGVQDYLYKQDLNNHIFERIICYAIERNKFISEIKISKEREENLLNAAGEGILGINADGDCVFINPVALSILGYKKNTELLGKHLHSIIHHTRQDGSHCPDHECRIYNSFRQSIAVHVDDDIFWRADGSCVSVEYNSMPLEIGNNVYGSVVTFSDITLRKKMLTDLESAKNTLEQRVQERTRHLELINTQLNEEIKERKNAQEIKRKTDKFNTALINTQNALVVVLNHKGEIILFNPACEKATGYSLKEVIGSPIWDILIPQDEVEKIKRVFSEICLSQIPGTYKNYWVTKSGKKRYISWSNSVLRDIGEQPDYIIATGLDITEQHKVEKALIESENKFRDLTEKSLVGVYLIQNGRYQYINPRFATIFGYSQKDLINKRALPFIDKKDIKKLVGVIRNQLTTKSSFHTTLRCIDVNNNKIDIETFGTRTMYEGKQSIIGTVQDITKRKLIEQTLQEQMLRYEQILHTSMDGFLLINEQGKILDTNPAYCRMLGYSRNELLNLNLMNIEINLNNKNFSKRMEILGTKDLSSYETKNRHKNGSIIDVEISLSTIDSDNSTNATLFIRDITQRKQQETSDKKRLMELAHVSRLSTMGEMTTEIAHELNQPLSAISTYSNIARKLLSTIANEDDDLIEAVQGIYTQTNRASEIIRSLRDFTSKHESSMSQTNVNDLVLLVIQLLKSEIMMNHVSIELELLDKIPKVLTEKILIEQVLVNIIRNALDAISATPQDQRKIVIKSFINKRDMIEINIIDNGPGLPSDQADVIFNAFYSTKEHGMGMGLSICRSIIESHGGKLWAEEHPALGAQFNFTLPVSLEE